MSNTNTEIIVQVRAFLKRLSWKKILTLTFFVILSSIFWFATVVNQTFEDDYYIPLKYVNIPDSITFDTPLPEGVNVKVEETGANIFLYFLTKRQDSLVIDIRQNILNHSGPIILEPELTQMVKTLFLFNTRVLALTPETISLANVPLEQKELPVIYDGYIDPPTGYLVDEDIVLYPEFVTAYGSRQRLDSLDYAYTVNDTIRDVVSNKPHSVAIAPVKGVKFLPDAVQLSVHVDEYTTKTVVVPIKCINLPSNLAIRFFPSSVSVSFFIGLKRYSEISGESFNITVDYNDIKNLKTTTIPVRIIDSPIPPQTLKPHEIEFILEQK